LHLPGPEAVIMTLIHSDPPADNLAVREALYNGTVFRLPPTATSLQLVDNVLAELDRELGDGGPIRQAQFRYPDDEFFRRAGRLRRLFYMGPTYHQRVRSLMAECGFVAERTAFDPIRLRVVAHRGFENPRAAPVFYPHRDTWYANPQAQITWWIPLHDLAEPETFIFYPDYFAQSVANNSEVFDYTEWTRNGWSFKVGWQDPEAGARAIYPTVQGEIDHGTEVHFTCQAGEVFLFAGAHFHQTVRNMTGQTRFSLDFRTVDLADHATGSGAPNVDNRSRGSAAAVRDYVQPSDADSTEWGRT
jgi:hypothetical protein